MKILVLGHNGLLGNCVFEYLKNKNYDVSTLSCRFPSIDFLNSIRTYDGDYIINCIGRIPQKNTLNFNENASLPIILDTISNCKIIHPSTDCEIDNSNYGISKKLATDYLMQFGVNTKIIKCSIIGIEKETNYSLLSWAISQKSDIDGFTSAKWNGITTLQWVKIAETLMLNWNQYKVITNYSTNCISKYELLKIIIRVFDLKIKVREIVGNGHNKCIKSDIFTGDIESQLIELRNFYGH